MRELVRAEQSAFIYEQSVVNRQKGELMKKKKIYSIPAKIITIAVLAVSAFLAALAGMRIAQGYWIGMTFSEMARGTFYENSTAASKYLYREGSSILANL